MTMFTRPASPAAAAAPGVPAEPATAPEPGKHPPRPPAWSLRNWSVGWKIFVIGLVPLVLATVFGGLRVEGALAHSGGLRLTAARAALIPPITKYMSALDVALLASSTGREAEGAKKNFEARKYELQTRLADTDVIPDVRSGVSTLLNGGQALMDKVLANSIGLRDRVAAYAPILLTAEDAINASVRADSERIRAQVQGLSRAVGARGQMTLQQILVTRGGDLPKPQLRTSMITLAGTEPSTLFGISEVLGVGSPDSKTLQKQMVTRMEVISDPDSVLANNPELLESIQVTQRIAEKVIKDVTESVPKVLQSQATARRDAATRDAVLVAAAILIALGIVLLAARALVGPLRVLRDGALKVAHTDLEEGIARVRAGAEPVPEPLAVYTTEEIGQVAHAVDELHTRALLLAGDEARLRLLVNDMFETMSRRSRALVDQQLSLIDGLERNEEDPDRLETLFRLDHLAARLRRNSANLLVLAGAQISRDQRESVALSTAVNAAVSEVEDYRRVTITRLPQCAVVSAAVGGVIHLLAELIDNALRYSPPTAPVRVSAARGTGGSVLLRVADAGLGMTDADRRIANMRLQTGGEVTPDNARHMGLFVVGRLAGRHGIRVGLRGPAAGKASTGTTAEVYLPLAILVDDVVPGSTASPSAPRPTLVDDVVPGSVATPRVPAAAPPGAKLDPSESSPEVAAGDDSDHGADSESGGPGQPITVLPRRSPGSSGISDVPVQPSEPAQRPSRRELPTPWWENGVAEESEQAQPPAPAHAPVEDVRQGPQQAAAQTASDTSAFFASRPEDSPDRRSDRPVRPATPQAWSPRRAEDDVIYQRMLSESPDDPRELAHSADLNWQSVWDHGWSAAAAAEDRQVDARTDQGLPVRTPGARLVPGAANRNQPNQGRGAVANGGFFSAAQPRHAARPDPEAVRTSMKSHFDGVRTGRLHRHDTRLETNERPDQE